MQATKEDIDRLITRLEDAGRGAPPPPPPLNPSGGGGTFGGMEARVAKLEADVAHLVKATDRLADVPKDLAVLKTRVDELPKKSFIVSATVSALALVAAISAFVQWVLSAHG